MDLTNINTIKDLAREWGIKPSKNFGQNFLINQDIISQIISSADLKAGEEVLEIGPGFGVLTQALLAKEVKLTSIELDKRLADYLKMTKKNLPDEQKQNFEIIQGDALDTHISKLFAGKEYKLVANLPYQITSPVLWKFLTQEEHKPTEITVMIQKEVAERITASPGKMSVLSVMCQFYAEVSYEFTVSRQNFWPAPDVDSAVVKLKIKNEKLKIDEKKFTQLVKIGFAQKRKMLKNNLSSGLKMEELETLRILEELNLNPKIRAQELKVEEWINLLETLK